MALGRYVELRSTTFSDIYQLHPASNTGTCLYMGWTALGTLILFINSVVWADNSENWAPVWCDITSRVIIGLSVAIPASSLCINRRLYKIAAIRSGTLSTKAEVCCLLSAPFHGLKSYAETSGYDRRLAHWYWSSCLGHDSS